MGSAKPQAQWRRAAEESAALVDNTAESDGLKSLRELRDKYARKANWLMLLGKQDAAAYYIAAIGALTKLIGPEIRSVEATPAQ